MSEGIRRYRLYDLVVESSLSLALSPIDDEATGAADDTWRVEQAGVELGSGRLVHDVADFDGQRRLKVWADDDHRRIFFSHGDTRVAWDADRRHIRLHCGDDMQTRPAIVLERVAAPIALMLQRPNCIALHASAVGDADQNAWIFVGDSGAGKSTTALELMRRGMTLLADDLVLIDVSTGRLASVTPAVRLFDRPGQIPEATDRELVMPEIEKFWYRLPEPGGDHRIWTDIQGVFSLEPDHAAPGAAIERLEGREALVRLLAQSFDLTEASSTWKEHRFRSVCQFARQTPTSRIEYPQSGRDHPVQVDAIWKRVGTTK